MTGSVASAITTTGAVARSARPAIHVRTFSAAILVPFDTHSHVLSDAEGNGDSIPAAVQTERVALLVNVLAKESNPLALEGMSLPSAALVSSQHRLPPSSAPAYSTRFYDGPSSSLASSLNGSPLLPPNALPEISPIYQTSGAELRGAGGRHHPVLSGTPNEAPLLPSFLQDIVHSPSQSPSPTSTSSADFSFDSSSEDAHYVLASGAFSTAHPHAARYSHALYSAPSRKGSGSSPYSSLGRSSGSSIWQFDGEESKALSSSSNSSSARTSPTAAFAQALHGYHAPIPVAIPAPVAVSVGPVDSGTTPKNTADFWQARFK